MKKWKFVGIILAVALMLVVSVSSVVAQDVPDIDQLAADQSRVMSFNPDTCVLRVDIWKDEVESIFVNKTPLLKNGDIALDRTKTIAMIQKQYGNTAVICQTDTIEPAAYSIGIYNGQEWLSGNTSVALIDNPEEVEYGQTFYVRELKLGWRVLSLSNTGKIVGNLENMYLYVDKHPNYGRILTRRDVAIDHTAEVSAWCGSQLVTPPRTFVYARVENWALLKHIDGYSTSWPRCVNGKWQY